MSETTDRFDSWAILELMGHRRLAGRVSEATLAGGSFLRIDVPEHDGHAAVTQFYAPHSVYALTPCSEEVARAAARWNRPEPVHEYELRQRALPEPAQEDDDPPNLDDDDSDDGIGDPVF